VAVLLGADLYEFSWRYQLPALITLPVAAALGVTAVTRYVQARRTRAGVSSRTAPAQPTGERAAGDLAAAVSEQAAS
jgi:hypothetical protein